MESAIHYNQEHDDKEDINLYQLVEMFPKSSIPTLKKALENSSNDIELAISMLLSNSLDNEKLNNENVNDDAFDDLQELNNMFPLIDSKIIESYYHSKDDSLLSTITELLNFEFLSSENADEQKLIERRIKNISQDNNSSKIWNSLKEQIDLILKYTLVNEATARKYYYQNYFNPIITIISIIHKQIKDRLKPNTLDLKQPKTIQRGGRVQSHNGFAYTKQKLTESNKPVDLPLLNTSEPKPNQRMTPFKYSKDCKEVKELENIMSTNRDLKSISPRFAADAIQYYNGSVSQVIDLLLLIALKDGAKFTFHLNDENKSSSADGFITVGRSKNQVESKANSPSLSVSNNSEADVQLKRLLVTFRLDFHGFLPAEAVSTLIRGLQIWWATEIQKRELSRKRLNLVNVCCVSPLIVITGRGVHSVGGVSKVRIQVRKALKNSDYVFDEDPSFFTIYGKRSR